MIGILHSIKDLAIFLAVLSVMIIVHEWGHFITAKRLGVRIEKFAIGFGPKLFSFLHDGTNFMICLIPLGGYVKMAGDERTDCKGEPDEFYSKPPGHRALIALNGPVLNYILAYLALVVVFTIGFPHVPARIGEIMENSPAQEAGLQMGDKILAVNSKKMYGWTELATTIAASKSDTLNLTILRDGQEITKIVPTVFKKGKNVFNEFEKIEKVGIVPFTSNVIGEVLKESPAEKAGLQTGDAIIAVNSQKINNWEKLQTAISDSKEETIKVRISREDKEIVKSVTPKVEEIKDENGELKEIRMIGVSPEQEFEYYKFSLGAAFVRGFLKLKDITLLTYKAIYYMVTGAISAKQMTGPVGIFYFVKSAAEEGIAHLLFVVGLISASLAIFNLLPVIPLDGGHLLLLAIEKVRGKTLPAKVDDAIARLGFGLIICLALFVFYNDFLRFGWIDKILNLWH